MLSGHVLLSAGSASWEGRKGDLLVIPPERHCLDALKDAVVVLTTAMVRRLFPTAPPRAVPHHPHGHGVGHH